MPRCCVIENYKVKAKRKRLLGKHKVDNTAAKVDNQEPLPEVIPWFSVTNRTGAGRKRRVAAWLPGDTIEMRDGQKYEAQQNGEWRRVRE